MTALGIVASLFQQKDVIKLKMAVEDQGWDC